MQQTNIHCSTATNSCAETRKWKFKQCFGEHRSLDTIKEGDMLTAVEFSKTGDYIATGDRAGRVVIFEQNYRKVSDDEDIMNLESKNILEDKALFSQSRQQYKEANRNRRSVTYRFQAEFQSHRKDFDCLKSLEIDEKINKIRFCEASNDAIYLLTTNEKTIKLWKVNEQQSSIVLNRNLQNTETIGTCIPPTLELTKQSFRRQVENSIELKIPKTRKGERRVRTREKKVFSNAHAYHINGLSILKGDDLFITSDDLRLNIWNLHRPDEVYNVIDIKPDNMENLAEVITCCEGHPQNGNIFIYSSSRGTIKLSDLRDRSNCDKDGIVFLEKQSALNRWYSPSANDSAVNISFFTDVLASISDISFVNDGSKIVARDYLTVKIWDVRKKTEPLQIIDFLDHLKSEIKQLCENDSIYDKFEVSTNQAGNIFATGTYDNCFYIFDEYYRETSCIDVLRAEESGHILKHLVEESSIANPITLNNNMQVELGNTENVFTVVNENLISPESRVEEKFPEHKAKALHLALHPDMNCLAVAVENNLYVYGST